MSNDTDLTLFGKIWTTIEEIIITQSSSDAPAAEAEAAPAAEAEAAPAAEAEAAPAAPAAVIFSIDTNSDSSRLTWSKSTESYKFTFTVKKGNESFIEISNLDVPNSLDTTGLFILNNNNIAIHEVNQCTTTHTLNLVQYVDPSKNRLCMVFRLISTETKSEVLRKYLYVDLSSTDTPPTIEYNDAPINDSKFEGLVPTDSEATLGRRTRAQINSAMKSEFLLESKITNILTNKESSKDSSGTGTPAAVGTPDKKKSEYQVPASVRSPIRNIAGYGGMPLGVHMYDLATHTVDGLGIIAGIRSPENGTADTFSETEDSGNIKSIRDQLSVKSLSLDAEFKLARAVNDTVDRAHDFEKDVRGLTRATADLCGIDNNVIQAKVTGLFGREDNINVNKSHEIQETTIRDLEQELRKNKIAFPAMPEPVFLSRMQVFAKFTADLMNSQPRRHYPESGKIVTGDNLKTYLSEINDEHVETLEIRQFVKLVAMYLNKPDDVVGSEKVNFALSQDIKKNCFQRIDGCVSGGITIEALDEMTISNVFGCLNVKMKSEKCDNSTIKNIIEITDLSGKPLLKTTVAQQITYDNVVNTINELFPGSGYEFPVRGSGSDPIGDIKFNDGIDKSTKLLLLMCLKTFCDKLYRLSIPGDGGITHIYTIDSYVYGDPMLQYLTGEADYCPTVMRSGQGFSDGGVDDCDVPTTKTKGFWVREGVGKGAGGTNPMNELYKKTKGYISFLNKVGGKIGNVDVSLNIPETETNWPSDATSDRLVNFVNRFNLCYNSYVDGNNLNTSRNGNDSYTKKMRELFKIELQSINSSIKTYITSLNSIIGLHSQLPLDISKLGKELIELPDLENLLTMSVPNLYLENENTLFFDAESTSSYDFCNHYSGSDVRQRHAPSSGNENNNLDMAMRVESGSNTNSDTDDTSSKSSQTGGEGRREFITSVTFTPNGTIEIVIDTEVLSIQDLNEIVKDTEYTITNTKKDPTTISGPTTLGLLCYLHDNKSFFITSSGTQTRSKKTYDEVESRMNEICEQYKQLVSQKSDNGDSASSPPELKRPRTGSGVLLTFSGGMNMGNLPTPDSSPIKAVAQSTPEQSQREPEPGVEHRKTQTRKNMPVKSTGSKTRKGMGLFGKK